MGQEDDRYITSCSTKSLKQALGPEHFLLLVEKFGGVRVYISKSLNTFLRYELGEELLALLQDSFSGDYVKVPLGREERVFAYLKKGYSRDTIARLTGLSADGVGQVYVRFKKRGMMDRGPVKRVVYSGVQSLQRGAMNFADRTNDAGTIEDEEVAKFIREQVGRMSKDRIIEHCVNLFGSARSPSITQFSAFYKAVRPKRRPLPLDANPDHTENDTAYER